MAGIVRPKRSYAEHRAAFDEKRRAADGAAPPIASDTPDIAAPAGPPKVALPHETPPRTDVGTKQPAVGASAARRAAPAAADQRAAERHAGAAPEPEGIVVRFNVPAPAPGTFPFFDKATAEMGELRALQRILARALGALAREIDAGRPIRPATYPVGETRFHTSRNLPPALHAAAKAAFDPLDLETAAELGRRLGMTAIARYLKAQK